MEGYNGCKAHTSKAGGRVGQGRSEQRELPTAKATYEMSAGVRSGMSTWPCISGRPNSKQGARADPHKAAGIFITQGKVSEFVSKIEPYFELRHAIGQLAEQHPVCIAALIRKAHHKAKQCGPVHHNHHASTYMRGVRHAGATHVTGATATATHPLQQ